MQVIRGESWQRGPRRVSEKAGLRRTVAAVSFKSAVFGEKLTCQTFNFRLKNQLLFAQLPFCLIRILESSKLIWTLFRLRTIHSIVVERTKFAFLRFCMLPWLQFRCYNGGAVIQHTLQWKSKYSFLFRLGFYPRQRSPAEQLTVHGVQQRIWTA